LLDISPLFLILPFEIKGENGTGEGNAKREGKIEPGGEGIPFSCI